jgi:hypothetical protein
VPWFPVDDAFHSHPKVLATSLAALGLWAKAGSWCMDPAHITDGVVPAHVLASLGGTDELAAELVTNRLWRRTRKGYVFNDWFQWGSKRSAEQQRALSAVRAENGRKGGLASGKTRAKPKQVASPVASPLVDGGLNPNTNTKELPPNPPQAGGSAHRGQHPNCRECGTNPRGKPPEPPPTPVPPPVSDVLANGGRPLRGQDVAAIAAQARQAITRQQPAPEGTPDDG